MVCQARPVARQDRVWSPWHIHGLFPQVDQHLHHPCHWSIFRRRKKISLYTFVRIEVSTFLPKTSYAQQYHNSCQNGRISVPRHAVCNVTQPGYGVRGLCDWPCAKYPTVANILAHALQNSKIALRNVSLNVSTICMNDMYELLWAYRHSRGRSSGESDTCCYFWCRLKEQWIPWIAKMYIVRYTSVWFFFAGMIFYISFDHSLCQYFYFFVFADS